MSSMSAPRVHAPHRVSRGSREPATPAIHERFACLQRAFCAPPRLQIVRALSGGPLSVKDLAAVIEQRLPATSHHLRVLRELDVVRCERKGQRVYYRLSDGPLAAQVRSLLDLAEVVPPSAARSRDRASGG